MSVRLDAILAVASVAEVLALAHVASPMNEREAILCPLPGHAERTPSFRIQASGRGFRCHGCGAHGGVLDLAVALGLARDRGGAVDFLGDRYGIPNDAGELCKATRHVVQRKRLTAAFTVPPNEPETEPAPEDREALRRALQGLRPLDGTPGAVYLASRGLCGFAAAANDTKYHPQWLGRGPAVVFAVRDRGGRLVAAQGRYLDPAAKPKAMTRGRVGLGVYRTASALDPHAEVVAIVEAPLDALSLAVCEMPAIALCGAQTRPPWLRQALAFRSVVLATDNDTSGEVAATNLRAWLNLGTRCSRLVLPAGLKDANEMLRRDPVEMLALARRTRFTTTLDRFDLNGAEEVS